MLVFIDERGDAGFKVDNGKLARRHGDFRQRRRRGQYPGAHLRELFSDCGAGAWALDRPTPFSPGVGTKTTPCEKSPSPAMSHLDMTKEERIESSAWELSQRKAGLRVD
ncbi:MAG: hypothetical protein ABIO37_02350 [Caulobacteraceae bacterium]